jgi:hypothetical protein
MHENAESRRSFDRCCELVVETSRSRLLDDDDILASSLLLVFSSNVSPNDVIVLLLDVLNASNDDCVGEETRLLLPLGSDVGGTVFFEFNTDGDVGKIVVMVVLLLVLKIQL